MNVTDVFEEAKEALASKSVFGTPYEKNGVTIIPAARIMGGAGGGEGPAAQVGEDGVPGDVAAPTGFGGGFGMSGNPTGAFVIKGDDVKWIPAVDVNRLMFGFQVVLIVFFLAVRSIAKSRASALAKSVPFITPA